MEAALRDLRAAKESLDKAENNRGGHRARAIELVEQAIAEVKAGIEDRRSPLISLIVTRIVV
jgi:hypothetical protein